MKYSREYYLKHKEEYKKRSKEYYETHKEKCIEYRRKYYQEHKEQYRECCRKSYQKFKNKVNWSKYCGECRKRRVEKLREQGVKNPWSVVVKGAEPKY